MLWSLPLPYIASQCGWIVAEVGRQPWVIQDYLPTLAAVSNLNVSAVQVTFLAFCCHIYSFADCRNQDYVQANQTWAWRAQEKRQYKYLNTQYYV